MTTTTTRVGWWWFPTTTGRWKRASLSWRSECDKSTARRTVRSRVQRLPAAHSVLYEYWARSWTRSFILLRVNARSPPGL